MFVSLLAVFLGAILVVAGLYGQNVWGLMTGNWS